MDASQLYFRVKDNGATVFRIVEDGEKRRVQLEPLANVNLRKDEVKPQGSADMSAAERDQITSWMGTRRAFEAVKKRAEIDELCDRLGYAVAWVKSAATDAEIDQLADPLLWGMHDLRAALVRRKSVMSDQQEGDASQ